MESEDHQLHTHTHSITYIGQLGHSHGLNRRIFQLQLLLYLRHALRHVLGLCGGERERERKRERSALDRINVRMQKKWAYCTYLLALVGSDASHQVTQALFEHPFSCKTQTQETHTVITVFTRMRARDCFIAHARPCLWGREDVNLAEAMPTSKHWTTEPDGEVNIKVSRASSESLHRL